MSETEQGRREGEKGSQADSPPSEEPHVGAPSRDLSQNQESYTQPTELPRGP